MSRVGGKNLPTLQGGGAVAPIPLFLRPWYKGLHTYIYMLGLICYCNPFALFPHIWTCKYTWMFSLCAYRPTLLRQSPQSVSPKQTPPPTHRQPPPTQVPPVSIPTHSSMPHRESGPHPSGGFRSPSSASRTKMAPVCQQRRVTSLWLSWAIFARVFPEIPVNISMISARSPPQSHSLLVPGGKKTKKTLACVFGNAQKG